MNLKKLDIKSLIFGALCIVSMKLWFQYLRNEQDKNNIASSFKGIIKRHHPRHDGDRCECEYDYFDLNNKVDSTISLTSCLLYSTISDGDSIEKNAGDTFILIKGKSIILKFSLYSGKEHFLNNDPVIDTLK
jgi:hypothetical protein